MLQKSDGKLAIYLLLYTQLMTQCLGFLKHTCNEYQDDGELDYCQPGGQCVDVRGQNYHCECDSQHKLLEPEEERTKIVGDGCHGCCVPIDECTDGPGANGVVPCDRATSTCQINDSNVGYICVCNEPYIERPGIVHDDFRTGCMDCCIIPCEPGFEYDTKDKRCEDVNECTVGIITEAGLKVMPCGLKPKISRCSNTTGGYECKCGTGYKLIENIDYSKLFGCLDCCVDINECESGDHDCSQRCENLLAPLKFRCACHHGYELDGDNVTCVHVCDLGNVCINAPESTDQPYTGVCLQITGGYKCECSPGFVWNERDEVCDDIDECLLGYFGGQILACDPGECKNEVGTYRCKCGTGYEAADADTVSKLMKTGCLGCCLDIDECADDSLNTCGDFCEFGTHESGAPKGDYSCGCFSGRYLRSNGSDCATCQFEPWSEWGECTGDCGFGTMVRTRNVKLGFGNDSPSCLETRQTSEKAECETGNICNNVDEEVSCEYGEWTAWSSCDKSCGGGVTFRVRTFNKGSKSCSAEGALRQSAVCNDNLCSSGSNPNFGILGASVLGGLILFGVVLYCTCGKRKKRPVEQMGYYGNYY